MSEYILSQQDYIYFILGLSLVSICMVCALFVQSEARTLPWMLFGMFGLTQGLKTWLDLYAFAAEGSVVLSGTRFALLVLSFILLWEFARIGSAAQHNRTPNRLLLLPMLLVLLVMTGTAITNFFVANAIFCYALALPACLWAALVLKREAFSGKGGGNPMLLIAAGALTLYGLSVGFMSPELMQSPTSTLNQGEFFIWTGLPVQALWAMLAISISASLWQYGVILTKDELISKKISFNYYSTIGIITGVVLSSIILSNWLGYSIAHDKMSRLAFIWGTLVICLLVFARNITIMNRMNSQFVSEKYRKKLESIKSYRGKEKSIDLVVVNAIAWSIDVCIMIISGIIGAQAASEMAYLKISEPERNLSICLAISFFVYLTHAFSLYKSADLVRRYYVNHVIIALISQYFSIFFVAVIYAISVANRETTLAPVMVWLFWWGGFCTLFTMLVRFALHGLVQSWRVDGRTAQKIAIVGLGEPTSRLIDWMRRDMPDLVQIVGIFDDRAERAKSYQNLSAFYQGTTDDLITLSRHQHIDTVVVALPHAAEGRLLELLFKLKPIAAQITLGPDLMGFRLPDSQAKTIEMAGLPLLHIGPTPLRASQSYIKELFDRIFALMALICLWPILLVAAIAIKLDSPGPVFFVQDRHGYGNKLIKVLKFRTMRADMADFGAARQTERNDPRVTRIGNFLRKTSIDELPQLLNVLHGDMSIVGPRPMPLQMRIQDKLNHEIVSEYAHRHRLKPGLTGWAQVNGFRGAITTEEHLKARIEHDLYYIDNWSLWFDIRIILMTVRMLFGHENAY